MTTKTIVMTLSKSTAGTHVYAEPNVPGKFFPVVYVQKTQLSNPPPQQIKVTVEWFES
jgi:hypothetical protein